MMLVCKREYVPSLNHEELLLVCRALGGRLKVEEVEAAKVLADEIAVRRAKDALHMARENDKLVKSLQEAGIKLTG